MTDSIRTKLPSRLIKGLAAFALAFSLILSAAPETAYADVRKADIIMGSSVDARGLSVAQCPSIEAQYAAVMGQDGTVYFERSSGTPTQIASITKIMTALVALDHMKMDDTVTVSARAAAVGESSASLREGDTLTFENALKALLIPSGNDAAVAIAETVGAKLGNGATGAAAESAFVDAMNKKGADIGLTETVFRNSHGLDDEEFAGDQHSSALDVAKMAKLAMQDSAFRTTVSAGSSSIPVTHADKTKGTIELATTDLMIGNFNGACGIKTGYTNLAGYSFAGAANRDGKDMYAIVIHSNSEIQRFTDAQELLDWAFEHNVTYPLAQSNQTASMTKDGKTSTVPVVALVSHSDWINKQVKATLSDPTAAIEVFDLNGNISQSAEYEKVSGDIKVGDKLGTITFKQRNNEVAKADIVACEDVKAPDLFEGIGIWWDRLFRGFNNQPTEAESVLLNETPRLHDKAGGS